MKTRLILFAAVMLTGSFAQAQVLPNSPLRITRFNRAGAMEWTNQFCTTAPVYDVLQANSPTGAWQHFFFVTNAHSAMLTNSLGVSPGAVFHKVSWANDTPMVFDYAFDEGYGYTAVSGQLTLNFSASGTNIGTWFCQDVGMINGNHPTEYNPCGGSFCFSHCCGQSQLWSGPHPFHGPGPTFFPNDHSVKLYFWFPGPEGVPYIKGLMQISIVDGKPTYTGMSGSVYMCGFAGCDSIGTFTATRVP